MAFDRAKGYLVGRLMRHIHYWEVQMIKKSPLIDETANIAPGVVIGSGVQIGRRSCVNGPCTIISSGSIGSFCSIASHVVIGPGEHPLTAVSTHLEWEIVSGEGWNEPKRPPVLGHDVWVGSGVTILRGAVIEDGAVIGAGSVVTGHIPAYAIAIGSPARVSRYRFDEDAIESLREMRWWDWSDAALQMAYKHFSNIDDFLRLYRERPECVQASLDIATNGSNPRTRHSLPC